MLDRHEAYVAAEVLRVMRPGGRFLTQQVDGRNFPETQAIFGGQSNYPDITLARGQPEGRTRLRWTVQFLACGGGDEVPRSRIVSEARGASGCRARCNGDMALARRLGQAVVHGGQGGGGAQGGVQRAAVRQFQSGAGPQVRQSQ